MDVDKTNPLNAFVVLIFVGVYRRLILLDFVTRSKGLPVRDTLDRDIETGDYKVIRRGD